MAETKRNEYPDLLYMCICMELIYNTNFILTLYNPQDNGTVMFDRITNMIDNIFTEYTSARFHISGDFNILHKEWLVHSNKTDEESRYCRDFFITYGLTQIIEELTHALEHQENLIDLFLTSLRNSSLKFYHFLVH